MQANTLGRLKVFQFNNLVAHKNLIHGISTRKIGNGNKFYALDLSREPSQEQPAWEKNRSILAQNTGIDENVFTLTQVHSTRILRVETSANIPAEADAIITSAPNLPIAVLVADCVPIILYDPEHHALGLVHAGWKGTLGRIAQDCVYRMQQAYGSKPAKMLAGIGPSIGPTCYETGRDVAECYGKEFGFATLKQNNGNLFVDLWESNSLQLEEAGLDIMNIEVARICTHCNTQDFYSYRQENKTTGRCALFAQLKPLE